MKGLSIKPASPTAPDEAHFVEPEFVEPTPAPSIYKDRYYPELSEGSIAAKVLAELWSGSAAVVVASPPGGGKTHLATTVASHLAGRAKMRIAIANACPVTMLGKSNSDKPIELADDIEYVSRPTNLSDGVVVATAAKWEWVQATNWKADLLIVDEAWQLMFRHLVSLAAMAPQLLLVGDSGQIGPVVTGNIERWAFQAISPAMPAPEGLLLARGDDVVMFHIPATRRLGPETTELIAPFYPTMSFNSERAPRHIEIGGEVLPEVSTISVDGVTDAADPAMAQAVAQRVVDLFAGFEVTEEGRAPLGPNDVAVVCAHVRQVSAVKAILGADYPDVVVETADRVQGLEWPAVVVWDPLAGVGALSGFDADPGRLCVMLSRHRAHATLVTEPGIAPAILGLGGDEEIDGLGQQVALRSKLNLL